MNHRFEYRFTKLFEHTEDGLIIDSIVAFKKTPWLMKVKPTATGRKQYIAQYMYRLQIDLWLVKVRFAWYGKEATE